ncbi:MAG: hypothetical protein A2V98_02115 [Planctomycetes bacterium RBG_16_64_12]|nr:MAG: hypothetical protein A2V98_02115 [Planctomycetes bacterium RBG_16_64_12]
MTKVLVVDDMPDMAKLLANTVEGQGYEALVASNGREALDITTTQCPDVILLDIMMPGMDGLEVLRRLKTDARTRAIPVILVTAKDLSQDIIAGLDAGAHDYVSKPFESAVLAARLRSAVRAKRAHDTIERLNGELRAELIQRERMEMELAQAQKLEAIGQLAAGIAHEINTPSQYIADNTRFLKEAFDGFNKLLGTFGRLLEASKNMAVTDDLLREVEAAVRRADVDYLIEEIPKAIQQSLEGMDRVVTIVRAMREFSHPGSEQKQATDLNRAIQNTLTVSRNEWKYVADVVTDFDPNLPLVWCLPSDFNRVILNLVVNAAQAIADVVGDSSQRKGTITVRTDSEGDWAKIRIEDTGTGIPEEIRSKVFDHFFTTKDVGKGTGQGLTIAQSIVVEKHGGTITFETEVGKGTAFLIRLPIADPTGPEQGGPLEEAELACGCV